MEGIWARLAGAVVVLTGVLVVTLRLPYEEWPLALTSLVLAGLGSAVALHRASQSGPRRGRPWILFGAGGLMSIGANSAAVLTGAPALPTAAALVVSLLELCVVGLFLAGTFWLVKLRSPGREHQTLLDGVAVAFVPMTIAWQAVVQPSLSDGLGSERATYALAYLSLASLMLWVSGSLWVAGPRSTSLGLVVGSAAAFTSYAVLMVVAIGGGDFAPSAAMQVGLSAATTTGGALAVLAALHRSWRGLTTELGPRPPSMTRSRLALLGVSLAAMPVGLLLSPGTLIDRAYYSILGAATVLLVGSRVSNLVADRNAAVERRDLAQARLVRQASEDPLTGLPNRAVLQRALQQIIVSGRHPCAVLFMDLDDFKLINDTLGHDAGDNVLRAVAQRLVGVSRPGEVVARFGGDEFVILVPGLASAGGASAAAARYLDATADLERVGEQEVRVRASIGVVVLDGQGVTPESLIRDADAAMYEAKSSESRIVVFNEALRTRALTQLSVEQGIRTALREDHLDLRYQRVVDLDTGRTASVEALVRWLDRDRGLRGPTEFIGVAERSGLIHPLGSYVLDKACAQWRLWHDEGATIDISVNVSARELVRTDYVDNLSRTLARHRVPAHRLTLELTERDLVGDIDVIVGVLGPLREAGVCIAVDDFGTGYFSLTQLRSVPIDILKIDRSFVADMLHESKARAIVRACVELGHGLGLHVVAEGVEDAEQMQALRTMGCRLAQGYAFGMPVTAQEVALPSELDLV